MMAATETRGEGTTLAERWAGGRSPWDVSWGKLMMWLFLASDAMTFAGLLVALWAARFSAPMWPNRTEILNIRLAAGMTAILIFSSTTMALSVYAMRRGWRRPAVRFLAATVVAGAVFVSLQALEWSHLIGDGAGLAGNPWGVPAFSFTFFTITGLHGLHVLGGVIYLWAMAVRLAKGLSSEDGLEIAGLYWGFVDLVWVFIWPSIYLL
jgi:cytochrome c oxidase subunit III